MKTIQGKNAAVTAKEDVIGAGGSLTLPTTARKHAIVSSSEEDDNNGEFQVETATVGASACSSAGNATVTVTAAGMTNSPKAVTVALAEADDTNAIATKIRAALTADEDVSAFFTVSGATSKVILTRKSAAANDATMNIAIAAGSTGITAVPTSADTTEGSGGSGARKILIEGINENYEEITEQIYLNGETAVNTTKYFRMINKMQVISCGSYGTNKGAITATALTDNTETCRILADAGESQNAYFMNAKNKGTLIVSKLFLGAQNATAGAITTFKVDVKEDGRAWCTKRVIQLIKEISAVELAGGIEVKEKAIIRVTATPSAGSSDVDVHMTL